MKRTAYLNPRSAARLVMAAACTLVLAAACTTDDDPLRPDAADADRPVPFTFTAVAPPAMTDAHTRAVPGNDTWKGDGTEKIRVRIEINENMNKNSTGVYTIISPEGKTAVLPGDEPALWPSKDEQYYVSAWYPAQKPGTGYDISDQSTPEKLRQADMLRAAPPNMYYNTTPVLTFEHRMAKVRVVLTGVDASATDIKVEIRGFTRFDLDDYGIVSADPDSEDYITACRDTEDASSVAFEAMLPTPRGKSYTITKQNFIRITTGGRTYYFTPGADSLDFLSRGNAYTYTVDLSSPTTRTAAAVIPGNSTVIPGAKAVIPGLTRDLPPRSTAPAVIPGLTRDLPPRRAGFIGQEIAGQARNDRGKESRPH